MRFGSDPISSPPLTPMSRSQSTTLPLSQHHVTPAVESRELSCLSPDSLSFHSLIVSKGVIITHFLPLHPDVMGCDPSTLLDYSHQQQQGLTNFAPPSNISARSPLFSNNSKYDYKDEELQLASESSTSAANTNVTQNSTKSYAQIVTTYLPKDILRSLQVDPPLALLCVDNDTPSSSSPHYHSTHNKNTTRKLPLLCIYNCKSVFTLDISYHNHHPNHNDNNIITLHGNVDSVMEPFEYFLLNNPTSSILRIKPAPNSHLYGGGVYNTLCCRGAMIMLTNDAKLVLYHGQTTTTSTNNNSQIHHDSRMMVHSKHFDDRDSTSSAITIPIEFIVEEIQQNDDSVVDFCFLPSSTSSLSSSSTNNNNHQNISTHGIWNSMTVALTTKRGAIYCVSPIVFHQSIFPKSQLLSAVQFLKDQIQEYDSKYKHTTTTNGSNNNNDNTTTNCKEATFSKQAKAALQYLKDTFGLNAKIDTTSHSYYLMANILNHPNSHSATKWPLSIQGPFFTYETEPVIDDDKYYDIHIACMEILPHHHHSRRTATRNISTSSDGIGSGGSMSAIVLADGENLLNYIILPTGTNILPRFAFETTYDFNVLNSIVLDSGILVDQITFDGDTNSNDNNHEALPYSKKRNRHSFFREVTLIPDPVDKHMIHHISSHGLVTISTNVLDVVEQKFITCINENINEKENRSTRTTTTTNEGTVGIKRNVWPSLLATGKETWLNGAVISGDAQLGHILVAIQPNGTVEAVNMTAMQYLNEASNLSKANESLSSTEVTKNVINMQAAEALRLIESVKPLHEIISPLLTNIVSGISSMGKVIGGSTDPKDITPSSLATILSMKQKSEKEIILPLLELNDIVSTRAKYLVEMHEHQLMQLDQLKALVGSLQQRMTQLKEKKKIAQSNSDLISEKSAAILRAVRDLAPTLTKAELEYFRDIERHHSACEKWEGARDALRQECKAVLEKMKLVEKGDGNDHNSKNQSDEDGIKLSKEQYTLCLDLLEGQKAVLAKSNVRVMEMEVSVGSILEKTGLQYEKDEMKPLAIEAAK